MFSKHFIKQQIPKTLNNEAAKYATFCSGPRHTLSCHFNTWSCNAGAPVETIASYEGSHRQPHESGICALGHANWTSFLLTA